MKQVRTIFVAAVVFLGAFSFAPKAHALTLSFNALNHWNQPYWHDYGVGFLDQNGQWALFEFLDMTMVIDTSPGGTGRATLSGNMTHHTTGPVGTAPNTNNDLWNFHVILDDLRDFPAGTFPSGAPSDSMFDEMKADSSLMLVWDTIVMNLNTSVANPDYKGPLSFLGKPDMRANPSVLKYRKWGGAAGDYWGLSAWARPLGLTTHGGDIHLSLVNPTVVPEPSTWLLVLMAFLALTFFNKFKNKIGRTHEVIQT